MALDDGFLLDGDSIAQLRQDHDLLASMVRSTAGRRIVLYPSNGGGSGGASHALFEVLHFSVGYGTGPVEPGSGLISVADQRSVVLRAFQLFESDDCDGATCFDPDPEAEGNEDDLFRKHYFGFANSNVCLRYTGFAFGRRPNGDDSSFFGTVVVGHFIDGGWLLALPYTSLTGIVKANVVFPPEGSSDIAHLGGVAFTNPRMDNVTIEIKLFANEVGDVSGDGVTTCMTCFARGDNIGGGLEPSEGDLQDDAGHIEKIGARFGDTDLGDLEEDEALIPIDTEVTVTWDAEFQYWRVVDHGKQEVACGLEYIDDPESEDDGKLRVKVDDLAGDGLTTNTEGDPEPCELKVAGGCGITVDSLGVSVDATQIAGVGLIASEGCQIAIDCDYIKENCTPTVTAGCGIGIDGPDDEGDYEIHVDNTALAGSGLIPEGECAIAIDTAVDPYGDGGYFTAITNITDLKCDGKGHVSITFQSRLFKLNVNAGGAVVSITGDAPTTSTQTADNCCCQDTTPCENTPCSYIFEYGSWVPVSDPNCPEGCECPPAPELTGYEEEGDVSEIFQCGDIPEVPPCENYCTYEWDAGSSAWLPTSDTCVGPDCVCPPPPEDPPGDGDPLEITLGCESFPPPPCEEKTCTFQWNGTIWEPRDDNCREGCECGAAPTEPGTYLGEYAFPPCGDVVAPPECCDFGSGVTLEGTVTATDCEGCTDSVDISITMTSGAPGSASFTLCGRNYAVSVSCLEGVYTAILFLTGFGECDRMEAENELECPDVLLNFNGLVCPLCTVNISLAS